MHCLAVGPWQGRGTVSSVFYCYTNINLNPVTLWVSVVCKEITGYVVSCIGLVVEVRTLTEVGRHCYHIGPNSLSAERRCGVVTICKNDRC